MENQNQPVSPSGASNSPTGEKVIQPLTPNFNANPLPAPSNPLQHSNVPTPVNPNPAPLGTDIPASLNPVSASVPPATATSPQSPQTASAIPPTQTASGTAFLTGSDLRQEKKKLPVGVYIIAGFNLLGFVGGFFDTSQASQLYTFAMLLNLLLGIGLLVRVEAARKTMVILSGLILVLSVASVVMLAALQSRLTHVKTDYESAISRIDQNRLSTDQKQKLATLNQTLESQQKKVGKIITYTYIKLGVTAVETVIVMVYLTRPSIKEVFENTV